VLYQTEQMELNDRVVGGGMNMIEIPSKHIEEILSGAAGDPFCFDKDHHYKQDNEGLCSCWMDYLGKMYGLFAKTGLLQIAVWMRVI
jgi:hypothetical protein